MLPSQGHARPLSEACVEIQFNQEGFGSRSPQEIKAFLDSQNTDEAVRMFTQNRNMPNPWLSLKIPHSHPRTLGIYQAIHFAFRAFGIDSELPPTPESWMDQAIELFSESGLGRARSLRERSPVLSYPMSPERLREEALTPRRYDESGLGRLWDENPWMTQVACVGLDLFRAKQCQRAVRDAYQNLYRYGSSYHLGNGWLVDLLTQDRAEIGGFRMVKKMLERLKTGDLSRASLIEDAYQSFEDPKTAETFLLLGLVHGQISFVSYAWSDWVQPYNVVTLVAAHVMSMLSAALDDRVYHHRGDRGIYVLPPSITQVCDNGKPYHFLVPWYISRRLIEQGIHPKTAAKVGFIFDWTYQGFSQSRGRDPESNLTSAFDSTRNQSHRVDLIFAGIGANVGSDSSGADPLDFEKIFNQTQSQVAHSFRPPQQPVNPTGRFADLLRLQQWFRVHSKRFSPQVLLKNTR